ncbi:ADP-ribose pyrophosphatase [Photobacterium jeanii]|uniref:ADP-ribose pyrophosphatase n=1 Tax=Photobacterium jeanii TaxID=858640 RepID=A0A178KLA0_9GAMM|nr:NUDIX hydrolase [Photobacterium jeanii]OAN18031.1 ADP-ribose pyrophosphatase [Photobacterium jeanii]PST92299.1 NUDIX domain-containing protein [Photobacterium jeanii]
MSQWLTWAKELQALSQAGKAYSKDNYDIERFETIENISHKMFAELSGTPVERVQQLFIPESGYPTPKVDLRAGVIKDNKILLVREREDNCWTLPGGWADVNETPSQGVIREVFEESGYKVDKPRLVAIKDRAIHPYVPTYPFHIYKMFFLCDFVSGSPEINIEISEIGFFELDNLPPLSESRVLVEDIAMMFEHNRKPNLTVLVD